MLISELFSLQLLTLPAKNLRILAPMSQFPLKKNLRNLMSAPLGLQLAAGEAAAACFFLLSAAACCCCAGRRLSLHNSAARPFCPGRANWRAISDLFHGLIPYQAKFLVLCPIKKFPPLLTHRVFLVGFYLRNF
jgi:hypothetical protein